jgi:FkbM family methyltransferase
MQNIVEKAVGALTHPLAAYAKLRYGLDFTETMQLETLRRDGLLRGIAGVIDAGAHHGDYALVCAHAIPKARIVCFEPLPEAYGVLVKRTSKNPQISQERLALGSKTQRGVMNISGMEQASSLLPMNQTHINLWPKSGNINIAEVNITTLDQYLRRNPLSGDLFLKIDVQGSELNVLEGAAESLRQVRLIRLEASFVPLYQGAPRFSEICGYLENAGFRFLKVMGEIRPKSNSLPVQGDVLFVRG